jgi:hypothetical protein
MSQVSLGGVTASHLSFGVASSELDSVNGVIGLGPVSLTYGDVTHVSETPTFMQVLTDQGTIVRTPPPLRLKTPYMY